MSTTKTPVISLPYMPAIVSASLMHADTDTMLELKIWRIVFLNYNQQGALYSGEVSKTQTPVSRKLGLELHGMYPFCSLCNLRYTRFL